MANAATSTFPGRSVLWGRMRGLGTEGKNIGWGTGSQTGSANANVNLFGPATEARTAGTSTMIATSFLADTYQVVGTVVCAVGAKTITEAGLFDTAASLSPTTTISASLTTASATITIGSATNLPTSGNYYAQLANETLLVTGANSTTLSVSRAQLGSAAGTQASGTVFTMGGDGGANANAGVGGQTATSPVIGGSIFAHADFAGIALSVNDSIAFTWTDQLTALLVGLMGGSVLWHVAVGVMAA